MNKTQREKKKVFEEDRARKTAEKDPIEIHQMTTKSSITETKKVFVGNMSRDFFNPSEMKSTLPVRCIFFHPSERKSTAVQKLATNKQYQWQYSQQSISVTQNMDQNHHHSSRKKKKKQLSFVLYKKNLNQQKKFILPLKKKKKKSTKWIYQHGKGIQNFISIKRIWPCVKTVIYFPHPPNISNFFCLIQFIQAVKSQQIKMSE